ncbi:MAG TPA: hypothetical protein VF457_13755 [Burkholderiaceae bacterium]
MDNFSRPSRDMAADRGALARIVDADLIDADDPLGDEAAFPSTWQQLSPADAPDE